MLPSEDLCPWGNKKEDGPSGHLKTQQSKMVLLSGPGATQPGCRRMELGLDSGPY